MQFDWEPGLSPQLTYNPNRKPVIHIVFLGVTQFSFFKVFFCPCCVCVILKDRLEEHCQKIEAFHSTLENHDGWVDDAEKVLVKFRNASKLVENVTVQISEHKVSYLSSTFIVCTYPLILFHHNCVQQVSGVATACVKSLLQSEITALLIMTEEVRSKTLEFSSS